MPLTHFLSLVAVVVALAALSLWAVAATGAPLVPLALGILIGAGIMRLMARVE